MKREVFKWAEIIYDFMSACPPLPEHSDLIIVLGSHDLRVAEYAAQLYLTGISDRAICTGGYGKMTEGVFHASESRVFADMMIRNGVPSEKILLEEKAANTGENFRFSRALCLEQGIRINHGIAVCKPYMSKRAWATGTAQWPEVNWAVSVPEISLEQYENDKNRLKSEVELMMGDLQRLWIYPQKGWQTPVSIPEKVRDAFDRLREVGFDRYLIPDT